MSKYLVLPTLILGLSLGTTTSASADRGVSTISGKRSTLSYKSIIKSRTEGERCQGTVCWQPPARQQAKIGKAVKTTRAPESRSRFGTRCASTFCRVN